LFRNMRRKTRRALAGFTLIEVLVALAIVGISLAAIGSVVGTTARGVRVLQQHVALVNAARAIEAGLPDRAELVAGSFSGEWSGNRWRATVTPFLKGSVDDRRRSLWVPQAVAITVTSPSGATLRIDTVRLHRRPPG